MSEKRGAPHSIFREIDPEKLRGIFSTPDPEKMRLVGEAAERHRREVGSALASRRSISYDAHMTEEEIQEIINLHEPLGAEEREELRDMLRS